MVPWIQAQRWVELRGNWPPGSEQLRALSLLTSLKLYLTHKSNFWFRLRISARICSSLSVLCWTWNELILRYKEFSSWWCSLSVVEASSRAWDSKSFRRRIFSKSIKCARFVSFAWLLRYWFSLALVSKQCRKLARHGVQTCFKLISSRCWVSTLSCVLWA